MRKKTHPSSEALRIARLDSVPGDWEVAPIGEVTDAQYGLSLAASPDGNVPMLGMQHIRAGRVTVENAVLVTLPPEEIEKYSLRAGDLLFNRTNSYDQVGKTGLFDDPSRCFVFASYLIRLISEPSRTDSRFLAYFLNSHLGVSRLKALATPGVSQYNINPTTLGRHFLVPIPPVREQKGISTVLSKWDSADEQIGYLLRAKRRLKRGLMQQLLTGKRQFGEFVQSEEVRNTPLGVLPKDWRTAHIGELFEQVNRKNADGVDRVLTASGRHGLVDQREYFNRSVAGKSLAGYYLLRRGEFAYNRSMMKGYPYGAIKRLDRHEDGVLSTLYLCFALASEEGDPDFFQHLFESGLLNRQLRGIVQVGARAHGLLNVSASSFFGLVVPVPSRQEQQAIARVLSAMDREIELLSAQLTALREQKRGLMQKLLTGQVRVKV